jgi:hypothetical protein
MGPRTRKGKEVSKYNATKHGLRAKEIVIPGLEDPKEFDVLLQELCDDLKPEGRTEWSLVEEIALDQWRLRRARRAEFGKIRRGMVDAIERNEPLTWSSADLGDQTSAVETAISELDVTGTVSKETCDMLDQAFGRAGSPAALLRALFHNPMTESLQKMIKRSPLPDGAKPDKRGVARQHLKLCWDDLERTRRESRRKAKALRDIDLQRVSIPKGHELIQRYATNIKRDRHRAIDQLERLRRRRRGEPPPPTVKGKEHLFHAARACLINASGLEPT